MQFISISELIPIVLIQEFSFHLKPRFSEPSISDFPVCEAPFRGVNLIFLEIYTITVSKVAFIKPTIGLIIKIGVDYQNNCRGPKEKVCTNLKKVDLVFRLY